jgi:uncharacterized protein (TIGR00730 family)
VRVDVSGVKRRRIAIGQRRSGVRTFALLGRAIRNFIEGFWMLRLTGPCVTVFGSARLPESHPYYEVGREVGRRLSAIGFTVMTGGGPGLMEAANRGARDMGGRSVGCNIKLPTEQAPNPYLDRLVTCKHFFVRKVLLFRYSCAFVVLPGGIGTMDELFEALTLVQTGKVEPCPIVLIGTAYWQPLLDLLDRMVAEATMNMADTQLIMATDDLGEAMRYIETHVERFDLRPQGRSRSFIQSTEAPEPVNVASLAD